MRQSAASPLTLENLRVLSSDLEVQMENEERTEKLLALILLNQLKGSSRRDKIMQLNLAGFSNVEIADILQTTSAIVSQALYETRKNKTRPSPRKHVAATK
jgi:predicted transcriptional regulator